MTFDRDAALMMVFVVVAGMDAIHVPIDAVAM
jgi:hypothetical protein